MEKDIQVLHRCLQQGKCCSRALVATALALRGEENEQMERAASTLCLGMRNMLTCGALTGAALCLGLFEDEADSGAMTEELTEWFQESYGEVYGGVNCRDILEGELVNKVLRCPDLMDSVWLKITELLEDEGVDLDTLREHLEEGI